MQAENQQSSIGSLELKLYIYGSRQSDQFWLPTTGRSHSKRPFCLTDIKQMQVEDEEGQMQQKKIYLNPLYGKKIFKIACGGMHSIVLTTEGEAFTFGCNDQGALGRRGPQQIPEKVKLQDPVDMISAGDNHSMFANSVNGAIYFSGNYNYLRGQKMTQSIYQPQRTYITEINHSLKNKKIDKITSGNNHSCVLVHGNLFCRGQPQAFTIGRRISARHKIENSLTFNGVNLSHITDVVCGGYHTIVRTQNRKKIKYYSWGKNDSGQLGVGSYEDQNYPAEIKKLRNKNIVKMAAGTSFSLFLNEDGQLYGCGSNQDSNLGLGQDYVFEQSDQQQLQQEPQSSQQVEKIKQVNDKKQKMEQNNKKQGEEKQKQMQQPKDNAQQQQQGQKQQKNQDELKKIRMHNLFIKSIRKIQTPQPLQNIATGSEYAYGWNKHNLYSWGSGMGYILLNGEEEDESVPFNVKKKILNQHRIYDMAPGGLHAMYTSYMSEQNKAELKIQASENIYANLSSYRKKLPRRKH